MPETRPAISSGVPDRYRDLFTRNITAGTIATAMDEADAGYPDMIAQLIEEVLEKDIRMRSAFQLRMLAVTCTNWTILPAREDDLEAQEYADFVSEQIDESQFRQLCLLQHSAVAMPFAVTWQSWGLRDGYAVPVKYQRQSPRCFAWDIETDELQMLVGKYGTERAPIPPFETVRSVYTDLGGSPVRAGLGRHLLWFALFKHSNLRHWIHYIEKYGMPMRVATLPSEDFLDPEMVEGVMSRLKAVGADLSAVMPEGSTLDVKALSVGDPIHRVLCDYIDVAEARLILGHELSSGSSPGSGQLGVSAAKDVRQEIRESDCMMLQEDIRRDVFRPMIIFNFGEDKAVLTPRLKFFYEEPVDQQQVANTYATMARYFPDLAQSRTQIRSTFGWDPPADADFEEESDAIFAHIPAAPGFGGGEKGVPDPDNAPGDVDKPGGAPDAGDEDDEDEEQRVDLRPVNSEQSRRRALPPSERNVQRLIADGEARSKAELLALRKPIRDVLKRAGAERWNEAMTVRALTQLYRRLNLSKTARVHAEKSVTARLFGRSAAMKGRR